ncbi:MAG: response regulator, partial [Gammaproteobacteria bacterium]
MDTGVGVSEQAQKKIFEAFQQEDASTTKKYGGTGLGLAICKQLVESMHGDIGIESSGMGSTFWFEIPFKEMNAKAGLLDSRHSTASGLRIIVVDDSNIVRTNLQQTFEGWGAYVVCIKNGKEAVNLLRDASDKKRSFDVGFVDELMGDENGIELIRTIAKDAKIQPLKLVLMTNQFNPEAFLERVREIDSYVKKPLRQSTVFNCISDMINMSVPIITDKIKIVPGGSKSIPNFNATILIVEDNNANQQVAQAMLERLGCNCSIAANGIEALKLLELAKYDAIFMDCNMPEMDGYETTGQIRQLDNEVSQIPIIAMTANVLDGDREKCIQAGMNDYTRKPLKLEKLIEKIERWVGVAPQEESTGIDTDTNLPITNETEIIGTAEQSAVNIDAIETLRENVGDGFNDMVQVYIDDMEIMLRSLEKSVEEKDPSSLRHYAHSIKGSSSNFGKAKDIFLQDRLTYNIDAS